jgi:hypothetical protein
MRDSQKSNQLFKRVISNLSQRQTSQFLIKTHTFNDPIDSIRLQTQVIQLKFTNSRILQQHIPQINTSISIQFNIPRQVQTSNIKRIDHLILFSQCCTQSNDTFISDMLIDYS